jgi:hypothetical protein
MARHFNKDEYENGFLFNIQIPAISAGFEGYVTQTTDRGCGVILK